MSSGSFHLPLRAALAAGCAVFAAQLLSLHYPIYALISAVIVTDLSPEKTRALAIPRITGTVIGTLLGALLSFVPVPRLLIIIIGILIAMLLTHLLHLDDAAKVAGYICGIVLLDHGTSPWTYALSRMSETLLGIAAAVLISVIPILFTKRATPPKPNNPDSK
jgi:uncharacterized membrane protein YgaE (UPF0421/DUF939 family)